MHFMAILDILKELRREKRGNEYSDAHTFRSTKCYLSCCFYWFSWMNDHDWNLRNSDIQIHFINCRKTNVFFFNGRERAQRQQSDTIFICLHKLLFWMTSKFELTIQRNLEWIVKKKKKNKKPEMSFSTFRCRKEKVQWIHLTVWHFRRPNVFRLNVWNCFPINVIYFLFMGLNGWIIWKWKRFLKKRNPLTHFTNKIIPLTINIVMAPT